MERNLTSLALIKAVYSQFEYKRDYIENFVPFIANLVCKKKIQKIDLDNLDNVIEAFSQEFGLKIPYLPMLTILTRCKRRKLFIQEHRVLFPVSERISDLDFGDIVVQKESRINELLEDISKYAADKFNAKISKDEAQGALLNYLFSHDMDIIFATQSESILPEIKIHSSLKYILAKYVSDIKDSKSEMFSLISEVAVGHILANTILYADKLQKYSSKFKGLFFYVDIKFVLRLLGCEGDLFQEAYKDLIVALKEQGANLCIFKHNYEEILWVFKGAIRYIDSAEYNPGKASEVLRYYRNAGKNKADIQDDLAMLQHRLERLEIRIVASPTFKETEEKQIDENALVDMINGVYARNANYSPEEKKDTVMNDVKSIASIYHLRDTMRPVTIKQAKAFFLTSNSGLAYAAYKYETNIICTDGTVPACITDVFIGTLVWMQSPVRWVELNKKKFLADCMALLEPSPVFIKKLVEEAEKLKEKGCLTDDEFVIVRSSIFVQHSLMHATCGDPEAINSENIRDVVERVKSEATAPLIDEIRLKDSEITKLKHEREIVREKEEIRLKKLKNRAIKKAKSFTNGITIILWVMFLVSSALAIINRSLVLNIIFWILSTTFAVAGYGFGLNIKNIREIIFSKRLVLILEKYDSDKE